LIEALILLTHTVLSLKIIITKLINAIDGI
jgi:hypothetical protein